MVEHLPSKQRAAGSNPVSRSRDKPRNTQNTRKGGVWGGRIMAEVGGGRPRTL